MFPWTYKVIEGEEKEKLLAEFQQTIDQEEADKASKSDGVDAQLVANEGGDSDRDDLFNKNR